MQVKASYKLGEALKKPKKAAKKPAAKKPAAKKPAAKKTPKKKAEGEGGSAPHDRTVPLRLSFALEVLCCVRYCAAIHHPACCEGVKHSLGGLSIHWSSSSVSAVRTQRHVTCIYCWGHVAPCPLITTQSPQLRPGVVCVMCALR